MSAPIGHTSATEPVAIALDRLIGSHACVVANSGGGKSGLVRRILETTYGQVQHIVFDPEDEFYSLRERFSYVIAGGDGGDIPATIEGAAALARATLEHDFSLIVQLNDLGADAPEYVAGFLGGLMAAPRELWRPVLVAIDEAQRFAPSTGAGTVASAAVQDLLFRGRKRGFTAILASLRISVIDPGIRGMCNNWLLGRVGQALDRNLMADQLGFTQKEGRERLRGIEERHFYGFGPAIAAEPILFRVDDVETTPVRPGQAKVPTPPAPDALRKILAGLPAPAPVRDPDIPAEPIDAYRVGKAAGELIVERDRRIEQLDGELGRLRADHARVEKRARRLTLAAVNAINALQAATAGQDDEGIKAPPEPAARAARSSATALAAKSGAVDGQKAKAVKAAPAIGTASFPPALNPTALAVAELLKAIAPDALAWNDALLLIGRRPESGDGRKARNGLRERGLIEDDAAGVRASSRLCDDQAFGFGVWPDAADLVRLWIEKLRGPGGEILEYLDQNGPSTVAAIGAGIDRSTTSGWWRQGMKDLTRSRIIRRQGDLWALHPMLIRDAETAE